MLRKENRKKKKKEEEGKGEFNIEPATCCEEGTRNVFPFPKCLSSIGLSVATLWLSSGAICRVSEGLSVITYMFLPAGQAQGINLYMLNVCIF